MSSRHLPAGAFLLITMACLTACSTSPAPRVWRSEPGLIERGLTVELMPPETGSESVRIRGDSIEGATFTGSARLTADGRILSLTAMRWFSNWANGWTEAHLPVTGELLLSPHGREWSLSVVQPPRLGDPVAASIRYFDDYLSGERGREEFAHRWDRILAVVSVLKQRLQERWFEYTAAPWQPGRPSQAMSFEEAARKFLFPELYGYADPPPRDSRSVRSESISWNVDYTAANFPENLHAVRNSGTMLRDFEECPGLWRLAYCLDELWGRRIGETSFTLIVQDHQKPDLGTQGRTN